MSEIIAVTGKGGTGKTTISGFLIDYLVRSGKTPVLAVDADANANLADVLGAPPPVTLAELRDTINSDDMDGTSPIPPGVSKQDWLDSRFATALTEEDDYDLLVMGRTQGRGCYCFVNGLLQSQIGRYAGNYRYLVVDNEAGMEHLSRGILPRVDRVIIVSDCSRRGIQAAGRIQQLTHELGLEPKSMDFIVNKAPDAAVAEGISKEIKAQGLKLAGVVPLDPEVSEYDSEGRPTSGMPQDSASKKALEQIFAKILG